MENLIKNNKTLVISSLDKENNPRISYSPFVYMNNKLYIYISKVAEHYNNILNNGNISVMIIEDEKDTKITFARNRVSFIGKATRIEDNEEIFEEFSKKQGESIMSMLRKMDFNIFEIVIEKGRYVEGFGKAFDIRNEDNELIVEHVKFDKGHNN